MEWLLLAGISVYAWSGLRIVSEAERLAVHRMGRFAGFRQPGMHFRIPGSPDVWTKLVLGMRGEALGSDLARFGAVEIPLDPSRSFSQGEFVRIEGFSESSVIAAPDAVQTSTLRCERCGHENPLR